MKKAASAKKVVPTSPPIEDGEQDKSLTYDASKVQRKWKTQLQDSVGSLHANPVHPVFLSGDSSGAVTLSSTASGKRLWVDSKAHNFGVHFVHWISAEMFVSFGLDAKIKVWSYDHNYQETSPSDRSEACQFVKSPAVRASWILADIISLPEKVKETWNCHYAVGVDKRIVLFNKDFDIVKETPPLPSTITGLVYNDPLVSLLATAYGKITMLTFAELFLDDPRAAMIRQKEKEMLVMKELIPVKGSFISLGQMPSYQVVLGGMQDDMVLVFDLKNDKQYTLSGYQGKVVSISVNKDETFMASAGGPIITVWRLVDLVSGKTRSPTQYTLSGHRHLIEKVDFNPHKNILLSYGKDSIVLFWNFVGRETNPKPDYELDPDSIYMRPIPSTPQLTNKSQEKDTFGKNTSTGIVGVTSSCWAGPDVAIIGYEDGHIACLKVDV